VWAFRVGVDADVEGRWQGHFLDGQSGGGGDILNQGCQQDRDVMLLLSVEFIEELGGKGCIVVAICGGGGAMVH